jgi:hypothetical protein
MQVIDANWDPKDRVWIACSLSLPCLVAEGATIDELQAKLSEILKEPYERMLGSCRTTTRSRAACSAECGGAAPAPIGAAALLFDVVTPESGNSVAVMFDFVDPVGGTGWF